MRELRRCARSPLPAWCWRLSRAPPNAFLMLSDTWVTTFLTSARAPGDRVPQRRLAGGAWRWWLSLSLPADRAMVRPFPMTDFTAPMVC